MQSNLCVVGFAHRGYAPKPVWGCPFLNLNKMIDNKQLQHIQSIQKILLAKMPFAQRYVSRKLRQANIPHILEYCLMNDDKFFFVDVFFIGTNKYLELDGRHHKEGKQRNDDKYRRSYIRKHFNLKEYRLKNTKAIKMSGQELKEFMDL